MKYVNVWIESVLYCLTHWFKGITDSNTDSLNMEKNSLTLRLFIYYQEKLDCVCVCVAMTFCTDSFNADELWLRWKPPLTACFIFWPSAHQIYSTRPSRRETHSFTHTHWTRFIHMHLLWDGTCDHELSRPVSPSGVCFTVSASCLQLFTFYLPFWSSDHQCFFNSCLISCYEGLKEKLPHDSRK